MSEDKELVEVWQNEFDKWYEKNHLRCFDQNEVFIRKSKLETWIAAKRSQPSVVLPHSFLHHIDDDECYVGEQVHAALTAAGIKYTIGE